MKNILKIIAPFILISSPGFTQVMQNPKNLKEAVEVLNIDASDSLKLLITQTADLDLKKISYPWGGNYMTIAYWTANRGDTSKIAEYLDSKGIIYEKEAVILMAFKQFLLGKPIDDKTVFKPFLAMERKALMEDRTRLIADTLRGVYIPKNVEDSFKQIDLIYPDSAKETLKKLKDDELQMMNFMAHYMFVNGWQLIPGSRLSKFFNDRGVYFPDEMSLIILTGYQRYLNNAEIKLDELIQQSKSREEKAKQDQLAYDKLEFAKFNIGDTVLFTYRYGFSSQKEELNHLDEKCAARGKIIEKNPEGFQIKIALMESCDEKGIITYDSHARDLKTLMDSFHPKAQQTPKPKKRVVNRMMVGQENWFAYDLWYKEEVLR